jgi:hypothetical protein
LKDGLGDRLIERWPGRQRDREREKVTKSLHYIILEYPRPEVICLWPKEQEPGLHQRNR